METTTVFDNWARVFASILIIVNHDHTRVYSVFKLSAIGRTWKTIDLLGRVDIALDLIVESLHIV